MPSHGTGRSIRAGFLNRVAVALFLLLLLGTSYASSCVKDGEEKGAREQTSVMMVLSPRMPYALKEWPRMRNVAENAGFKVMGVRDPRISTEEWVGAVQAAAVPDLMQAPVMDQSQAAELGVLNHAPASLVVRCGRAHPWPVLGVMPNEAWLSLLQVREMDLKKMTCC